MFETLNSDPLWILCDGNPTTKASNPVQSHSSEPRCQKDSKAPLPVYELCVLSFQGHARVGPGVQIEGRLKTSFS